MVARLLLLATLGAAAMLPAETMVGTTVPQDAGRWSAQSTFLSTAEALADRAIAMGAGCEELPCPMVDCDAIQTVVNELRRSIYVARQVMKHVELAFESADELDTATRQEVEALGRQAEDAISRLVDALRSITSCAGLCPIEFNVGTSHPSYYSDGLFGLDRNEENVGSFNESLAGALDALEIAAGCPSSVADGSIPLSPTAACPACEEAAQRYYAAERLLRAIVAEEDAAGVWPTNDRGAAENERDNAWSAFLRCEQNFCSATTPFPPPGGAPDATIETFCPRCETYVSTLRAVRRLIVEARAALAAAIEEGAAPSDLEDLENRVDTLKERLQAEHRLLQDCEARCAAGRGVEDELGLAVKLAFADDPFFDPERVSEGFEGPANSDPPSPAPGPEPDAEPPAIFDPIVDLSVVKTDSADPVAAGDSFVYEITVRNAGPDFAHDVVVEDDLPLGLQLQGVQTTLGMCSAAAGGGFVSCEALELAPGHSLVVSVTVRVADGLGGALSNTATVSARESDSNLANNASTENTSVLPPVEDPVPVPVAQCAMGITPGNFDGNGGLGIGPGTVVVSCPNSTPITITGNTTLTCDASGDCGSNNTIFGLPRHRVRIIPETIDRIRVDATELDENGQPTGRTGVEILDRSAAGGQR